MMSYVYAITDRPDEPLTGQPGLYDEELAQVVFRDISAVVSTHDDSHAPATAENLWRHEQVVESLMGTRTVLPVRFGTRLASLQAVEEMLCELYPASLEDIARVRDHVEIGIRFLTDLEFESTKNASQVGLAVGAVHSPSSNAALASSNSVASSTANPGTAYLRARLASERVHRERRRSELGMIREAYHAIAEHAIASNLNNVGVDALAVSATFLVHRYCLMSFQQLVAQFAEAHPKLALLCTGPWPAYSFVSAHAQN